MSNIKNVRFKLGNNFLNKKIYIHMFKIHIINANVVPEKIKFYPSNGIHFLGRLFKKY